jgi:hypothetical protein
MQTQRAKLSLANQEHILPALVPGTKGRAFESLQARYFFPYSANMIVKFVETLAIRRQRSDSTKA